MTNKTRTYNTGKVITHNELRELVNDAQANGDWSKVEQANVSKIKDMFNLFEDVKGIENLNLDGWDTSNVEDMGFMFCNSDYNHPLCLDTSNVKNMCSVFYKSEYNHPLYFDTSNVEDMSYMFANSKYNQPLNFDTSNIDDMEIIFENAPITCPITFKGGNIPDSVQAFIDETNTAYEEKCKLEGVIYNKCGTNEAVVAPSFKL